MKLTRYLLAACTIAIACSLLISFLTWFVGPISFGRFQELTRWAAIGWLTSYFIGVALIFVSPTVYLIERRSWLEDMFDRRSGINGYFPKDEQ